MALPFFVTRMGGVYLTNAHQTVTPSITPLWSKRGNFWQFFRWVLFEIFVNRGFQMVVEIRGSCSQGRHANQAALRPDDRV
jgi:hypothetical protein